MRIIRNYILRECLQPFTLSICVLTSVFLLGYLPQLANKVINNGVSLSAMSQVFLYYIPILLGYTLPIACLITVILALGHMSSENEILAMRASGIHLLRLLSPLTFVGITLCLVVYLLNDRIIPEAYDAQTRILQETGSQDPSAMLEPGSFINAFDKYIIFIYRMDNDLLYGVRIYEPAPNKPTKTIIAEQGEFVHVPNKDQLMLKLIDGTSDEPDLSNPNNFYKLNFQTSFITMDLSKKNVKTDKKSKAMTIDELKKKIKTLRKLSIDPSPLIAEYQRRLAWSLSPLIFIFLGFPFAAITHRRAKSANLLYALLFAAPYYILSLACQGMASQNTFNPVLLMWVPNAIAFALAIFLTGNYAYIDLDTMRILDRYILKSILVIFAGTVFTFAFLFILIDLFSNLQDFIAKKVGLDVIAQYYISFLPSIVVQTSTMACLISVLFTYSSLNAHNEIIAIRASGMNFWQITRPALIFALFVSALVFMVNEEFVPQSSMVNQEIRDTQIKVVPSQKGKGLPVIHNLTFYGLKNRLFFIDTFDPNTSDLTGITIIGHDRKQNLVEKIVALKGMWTGIAWKFYNCQITSYNNALPNAPPRDIRMSVEKLMDIKETPKDFLKQRMDISSMNLRQLHSYIKRFSGSGAIKTVNNLRVDLHQKITFPLRNFIIVLIGLPFALMSVGKRKAMTFTSIAIALVIGFLYYVADAVGLALAKGQALLPWEGAWLTPILFTLTALFIIFRNF